MAYQIDNDGTIIRTDDSKSDYNGNSNNNDRIVILILMLLTAIGFAIGLGVKKSELEDRNKYLQRELSAMKDKYSDVEN